MRTYTWIILVALAFLGLATKPSAQEAEQLDTKLFKKDRTWLVKRTDRNADKGKEVSYMQYKVKTVSAELAEVEQTQLDEKKKAIANSSFTIKVKLNPDFYWFKIPEGAEIKSDESVTVAAGTFDCLVYVFAGSTLYKSKKYPGLTVKAVSAVPEELIEFKTFKDDGVTAEEAKATPKLDFSLFKKKGRVWELTGKDSWVGEYVDRYEVLEASNESAKLKYTKRDKAGKPIPQKDDWTGTVKFDDSGKHRVTPDSSAKYEKDETITVAAGTFDTQVYFRAQSNNWDATRWWYSTTLPGLTVKRESVGSNCELTKLSLYKGEATTAKGPKAASDPVPETPKGADGQPSGFDDLEGGVVHKKGEFLPQGAADFRLYQLSGRKWSIQLSTKEEVGWLVLKPNHFEVKDVTATQCTLIERIEGSAEKNQPKPRTIDFAKQDHMVRARTTGVAQQMIVYPEQTIKVEAGTFDCYVYLLFERRKDGVSSTLHWMSKKYPGLSVLRLLEASSGANKSITRHELVTFQRDANDKGDSGNPVAPREMPKFARVENTNAPTEQPTEPDTTPADWSLFKKKGRKWTSKSSSKYRTTYSAYEILTVGKDFCEYKVATLDKDKKPIVAPSTLKLEFTDENAAMWVKPLPSYKKLREEKLKAAGVEWDCLVYEGSLLKDQTQTVWMSKKYPGLYIKIVTNTDGSESVDELIEFKD